MGTKLPPPLFSRRERYSLVLFSFGFIAFSAVLHVLLGGASAGMFPSFKPEPTPPPQFVILQPSTPRPTPSPTPTPSLTPPPPTPANTAPPMHIHLPHQARMTNTTSRLVEPHYTLGPESSSPPTSAPIAPPSAEPSPPSTPSPPLLATPATFRYKATPVYPEIDIEERIEGVAVVLVTIGTDGSLLDASIAESSGNANLDAAALAAARASLYTAPMQDGKPVEEQYKIVYEFSLDD